MGESDPYCSYVEGRIEKAGLGDCYSCEIPQGSVSSSVVFGATG